MSKSRSARNDKISTDDSNLRGRPHLPDENIGLSYAASQAIVYVNKAFPAHVMAPLRLHP